MDEKSLLFFQGREGALPIYGELERRILTEIGAERVEAKKTQISFFRRYMFACASFARPRRAKDMPDPFLTVTFGLGRRADSPRIDRAVEPYPGRWTHHVVLSSPEEVDAELISWLQEAAGFSQRK